MNFLVGDIPNPQVFLGGTHQDCCMSSAISNMSVIVVLDMIGSYAKTLKQKFEQLSERVGDATRIVDGSCDT